MNEFLNPARVLRPKPFAASPPSARRLRVQGAAILLAIVLLIVLLALLTRNFWGGGDGFAV